MAMRISRQHNAIRWVDRLSVQTCGLTIGQLSENHLSNA